MSSKWIYICMAHLYKYKTNIIIVIISSMNCIGPIWLDDVGCSSNNEILDDCYFRGWGVHNCGHFKDVGVVCRSSMFCM